VQHDDASRGDRADPLFSGFKYNFLQICSVSILGNFGGIFDLFNRLHFIIAKQTSTMPKTRIPILEVDVVLVQDIEDDNQFSVIVTCPTCGSVNEHGLGPQCNRLRRLPKDNISNWGHRECNGHGYELVAASVIHFKLQG
tara:strand:+ start:198 stop:617 length:420 start_codon:yes stop_codon:yes gene_type:complete